MLQAPVGVTASVNDGGISKRSDMGNGVEIFSTFPISDPQTFLTGSFEARIVSFALCAQSIQTLYSASCIGAGKLKVQYAEQLVIELDNTLGCKKAPILNQFLSIDSGQPLSA